MFKSSSLKNCNKKLLKLSIATDRAIVASRAILQQFEEIQSIYIQKQTLRVIKRIPRLILTATKKGKSEIRLHGLPGSDIINPFQSPLEVFEGSATHNVVKFLESKGFSPTIHLCSRSDPKYRSWSGFYVAFFVNQ